jgi:hypothetical protein
MNRLSRGNQILAAVLVVQIILAAVVLWPRGAATAGGEALFGELEASQIARISIVDAAGTRIELTRNAGDWVLASGGDYPAKSDTITALLDKLVAMTNDRRITETATSQKRLKVADDDYNRLVEFQLDDGTSHALYVGTSPTYGAAHVRVAGDDDVYLVSDLSLSDASVSASSWVDTVYFSTAADTIRAITIENRQGTFVFSKDEEGNWSLAGIPEGEEPNANVIDYVHNRVDDIRLLRPLGVEALPEYGLDSPNATVTIQHADDEGAERTTIFTVGAQDEADLTWVMKSSDSPYYVQVSQYTAEDLVNWDMDDFLVQPTPTPAPSQ